jgi:hypothetical protein
MATLFELSVRKIIQCPHLMIKTVNSAIPKTIKEFLIEYHRKYCGRLYVRYGIPDDGSILFCPSCGDAAKSRCYRSEHWGAFSKVGFPENFRCSICAIHLGDWKPIPCICDFDIRDLAIVYCLCRRPVVWGD